MRVISAIALCACVVALAVGVSAAPAADKLTSPLPGGFPAFMSDNYAGYLSLLDGREAFYWFVASESSPSTDPVMFWFNGGPGCSSLLGLFTENGPFVFQNGGVWGRNAYTWATNLNMVFMESPGGVGFSRDLPGPGTLWNDTYVAQLNYAGVRSWLAKFPEYTGRDLYIAGESYAGHYVPQLVYQIVTGPDATLKNMLQGFMTGNPCTGSYDGTNTDLCFVADDPSLDLFLKTHALTSLVPGQIPNAPGASLPYDPYDDLVRTCPNGQGLALQKLSKRPLLHDGVGDDAAAYGPCGITHLTTWLTNPDVVSAIHAKPGMLWSGCGNVNYPTPINSSVVPLYKYFMDNTELAILVYSGTSDTVVNFIQTQKIITAMGRPVLSEFTPWYYQDMYVREWLQVGGFYIKWDRISWAGVRGAGHMVPTYQPAAAKALLNSFLTTGRPGMAPPSLTSNATLPPPPVTATQAPFPLAPEVKKPSLSKGAALMIGLGATGFVVGIVVAVLFIKRQSAPGDADFARLK